MVWNYNAGGVDDTYRGVRLMEIALDGVTKSPVTGCLIRKAPGSSSFNFGQFVSLTAGSSGAMAPRQKQMQRREREEHCHRIHP